MRHKTAQHPGAYVSPDEPASSCGFWAIVGESADGVVIVHPLRCRSWNCPKCKRKNKQRLVYRLGTARVHSLLTLTCNPRLWTNPDEAFRRMSLDVNRLFKRIRRAHPEAGVEYFMVWERTKAGWPHIHLLLRAPYLRQQMISAIWNELTGAPVVDIRQIHSPAEAISYVAKYLAKDPQCPEGMKRFRFSRAFFAGVVAPPPSRGYQVAFWHLERVPPQQLAFHLSRSGFTVREHAEGTWRAWPRGHPEAPLIDSIRLHPECMEVPA